MRLRGRPRFSLDRVVFTALMMSDTLHQDASVNASAFVPFYALKLTSELLSLALSATAAVAVQFSSLRKKWDIVSKLETTMFAGVLLPLVVITSAVGYVDSNQTNEAHSTRRTAFHCVLGLLVWHH